MTYTLGEAAKATGKSKPTIHRAIKSGKISATKKADGSYAIDPAELHRVYPVLPRDNGEAAELKQSVTPANTEVLRVKFEALQQQLAREQELNQDLQRDRDHWRQQATALLTDQRETVRPERGQGRWARAWAILTGKA